MQDDAELWAWVNQVADAYEADEARLWTRVHQCQHQLKEAGYRTTPPPEHEAADWVLVIDTTNDEHGIPANKPNGTRQPRLQTAGGRSPFRTESQRRRAPPRKFVLDGPFGS